MAGGPTDAQTRPQGRGRHVSAPAARSGGGLGGALGLLLLSALLPGSAQVRRGGRTGRVIGAAALSVWVSLLVAAVAAVAYVLQTGDIASVASIAVQPEALQRVRVGAAVLVAGWVLLLLDAWRLTRPGRARPSLRVASGATAIALAAVGVAPVVVAWQYAGVQRSVIDYVFPEEPDIGSLSGRYRRQRPDGRVTILLLGGDGGRNREGVRTDAMQVATVDRRTGKAVLIALPRSLQRAPFPEGSPMRERFPDGFTADEGLLNSVYGYGRENPELFPGASDPGAEAITQAASEITGLPIDYYVLVNLDGFRDLVNAMGGIDMYVGERIPIGGRKDAEGRVIERPDGYIEPGAQHLNGYEALWFARSRFAGDDYSRMRRQRCVLGAIVEQADPATVLRNYEEIARSTKNLVATNIPRDRLPELLEIALDTRKQKIANVTFTRSVIETTRPDVERMRALVAAAVAQSTAAPSPTPAPTAGGATSSARPTPAPSRETGTSAGPEPKDVTDDLDAVCRYS